MPVKRAFKSSLRRLQCAIGQLLPRANHNQIYDKIYKLTTFGNLIYTWVAVAEKPIPVYLVLCFHICMFVWLYSGEKKERKKFVLSFKKIKRLKTASFCEDLFWEVFWKSEKSDKFVRHFQGNLSLGPAEARCYNIISSMLGDFVMKWWIPWRW